MKNNMNFNTSISDIKSTIFKHAQKGKLTGQVILQWYKGEFKMLTINSGSMKNLSDRRDLKPKEVSDEARKHPDFTPSK